MTSREDAREYTRRAFAPPTPEQKQLQAEARARGGLTRRGIDAFNRMTPEQQRESVERQEKQLGLREETTGERQQRLLSILENRGTFKTDQEAFEAIALKTGRPVSFGQGLIKKYQRKYGKEAGTKRAFQEAIVGVGKDTITPSHRLKTERVKITKTRSGVMNRIKDIDRQLESGLVKANKRQKLREERRRLRERIRPPSIFTTKPVPSKFVVGQIGKPKRLKFKKDLTLNEKIRLTLQQKPVGLSIEEIARIENLALKHSAPKTFKKKIKAIINTPNAVDRIDKLNALLDSYKKDKQKVTRKDSRLIKRLKGKLQKSRTAQFIRGRTVSGEEVKKRTSRTATLVPLIVATSAARAGKDYLVGLIEAVKNPASFAAQQARAMTIDLPKTVKTVGHEFKLDPIKVLIEFGLWGKTFSTVGKTIKRSPVGRYVVEESFILRQPKEFRPYIRKILKSSKVQEKINPLDIKKIKKVDFIEIKNLNPIEATIIKKLIIKHEGIVFGSEAARVLSGKKSKIAGDLDFAVKDVKKIQKDFIKELPKNLRKNYQIKGGKLIRKSDKTHLFDVKDLNRIIPEKSFLTKKGYLPISGYATVIKAPKGSIIPRLQKKLVAKAFIPTQKVVKVAGIKFIGFGEQTVRKALGTIQVLLEKQSRRAKDPQSFVASLEIQLNALKGKKGLNKVAELRNNRRIRIISDALKLLKSKSFADLLEKQVVGINKKYPILEKIDIDMLRKAQKNKDIITKKAKRYNELKEKQNKASLTEKEISELKNIESELGISELPSKIPVSKLPSRVPSRVPSKFPSRTPSKLPSRVPSGIPSRISGLKPSGVPSKLPSKVPPLIVSRLPSKIPSRVPSKVPSRLPTKVPRKVPSKLPIRRKAPVYPPPPRKIRRELEELKEELKKKSKSKKKFVFLYTPTLAGLGEVSTKTTGTFSGFETRGSIVKVKPIKVIRHTRRNLKKKRFVRKHRRRKPKQ